MANAAKKLSSVDAAEGIDIARARLVRRGPGRHVHLSLRTMREAAGKTQAQVSKASGLAQPEVSKLESASSLDDRQVSTLRRYVAALGDELDIVAVSKYGHRIGISAKSPNDTTAADGSLRAVDPSRIGDDASNAVNEFIAGDWERLVAIAFRSVATLFFARYQKDPTEEAGQAFAVAHQAITLLAGETYGNGDTEVPERVRRMHKQMIVDRKGASEQAVKNYASLLAVATKPSSPAFIAKAFVQRLGELLDGENLARAEEDPNKVVAVLQRWRAKPNRRKHELTASGVIAEVRSLAGEQGDVAKIRKRHAARERRRHA
jgi:transcriptional regulator with XRE-family HTH domain